MLVIGPLGFGAPWVLLALGLLPLIWWRLRMVPPAPRSVVFPAAVLLLGLPDPAPPPRRMPRWWRALRVGALAAAILAAAGPVWRPVAGKAPSGPLLVVLDRGWAAAPDWTARRAEAEAALRAAADAGHPTALWLGEDAPLRFAPAEAALTRLTAATPQPHDSRMPADPIAALAGAPARFRTLWLSDGLDHPGRAAFLSALAAHGPVQVRPPDRPVDSLWRAPGPVPALAQERTGAGPLPPILALGPDPQGREQVLARLDPPGTARTESGVTRRAVPLDPAALPVELRNRVTRFAVAGAASAGAVVLTDTTLRRPKLALVADPAATGEASPLLSPAHYLRRALDPLAEVTVAGLGEALSTAPQVIVMADQPDPAEPGALIAWVERGGLLIRFAGPRVAAALTQAPAPEAEPPLWPVRLRAGGRGLDGALSWGAPRGIAPFAADGPFAGLAIPAEVTVRAQLLADPDPELARRTLAALSDGTPLVTAAARGQGQVVLVHTGADPGWSSLPLSGLFAQMLDRLIQRAPAAADAPEPPPAAGGLWRLTLAVSAQGAPQPAPPAPALPAAQLDAGASPQTPPGLYVSGGRQRAVNAGGRLTPAVWPGAEIVGASAAPGRALAPLLWLLVLLALAGEAVVAARGRAAMAVLALLLAGWAAPGARAEPALDPRLTLAAGSGALGHILTGDAAVDQTAAEGLTGLSDALSARSMVEPGPPVGLDLERDDPSLFSLIYWPITDGQPLPSPQAYLRLNRYLASGGMLVIDSREGDDALSPSLRRLAGPLDLPPLAPIRPDHVLTRAFYLLSTFPGRWPDGTVWVAAGEAGAGAGTGAAVNDGVTPVVIGSADWAAAWAVDARGLPRHQIGLGGDADRQRELALRFGVNLVIHALTGNYKADQSHVPKILERLKRAEGEEARP